MVTTHPKNIRYIIISQNGNLPQIGGENKKYLSCHHLELHLLIGILGPGGFSSQCKTNPGFPDFVNCVTRQRSFFFFSLKERGDLIIIPKHAHKNKGENQHATTKSAIVWSSPRWSNPPKNYNNSPVKIGTTLKMNCGIWDVQPSQGLVSWITD